ncbi:MAG: O-antigen ligase family protein [PVC group bacterium]
MSMLDRKPSSASSSSLPGAVIWLLVSLVVLACLPDMMSGNYLPKAFWAAVTVGIGLALLPPRMPNIFNLTLLGAVWLAYLGWALLSLIWAPSPRVGFERWLALLLPTLAYLLARRTRFWNSEIFWTAFCILAGLVSAIGILQYFFPAFPVINGLPGTAVPRATLGSRNYACMYLMVTFPFLLGYFLRRKGPGAAIPFLAIIFSVTFLLLAKTRGAWVGLLAGLIYLAAGGYRMMLVHKKKLAVLVVPVFASLLIAYSVGLPIGGESTFKGKLSFAQAAGTLLNPQQRFFYWRPCLGITDPLLGAGFGNFPIVSTPRLLQDKVNTLNWEVHNDYLQAYVDLGIPGALLFALTFFLLLRLAWKGRGRGVILAAGASVVGITVMQFTTFTSEKVSTQIWLAGVAALLNSLPTARPVLRIRFPAPAARGLNYLAALWLFLFAAAVGYTIRGDRELRKEREEIMKVLAYQEVLDNPDRYAAPTREYVRKEGLYDRLRVQNRFNWLADRVLPTMLFDANMRHISCYQFAELAMSLKDYDIAEKFARRALDLHPGDRTSLTYLAEIALHRQDLDRARALLERGVKTFGYNPHAPYFCQTLIRLYQYEGRGPEGNVIWEGMNRNLVTKPSSPSPGNRESGVPPDDHLFDWADCNAATSYDFFLWKVGEEEPDYPTLAGLEKSRARPVKRLSPGTTYLWRVRALGRYGEVNGDIWVFRTRSAPRDPDPSPS